MPRQYNPTSPPVAFPTPWQVKQTRIIDARGVHLVFESQGLGHSGPRILALIAASVNALHGLPLAALEEVGKHQDQRLRLGVLRTMIDALLRGQEEEA